MGSLSGHLDSGRTCVADRIPGIEDTEERRRRRRFKFHSWNAETSVLVAMVLEDSKSVIDSERTRLNARGLEAEAQIRCAGASSSRSRVNCKTQRERDVRTSQRARPCLYCMETVTMTLTSCQLLPEGEADRERTNPTRSLGRRTVIKLHVIVTSAARVEPVPCRCARRVSQISWELIKP